MGMCLIAAALDPSSLAHWALVIIQVILGLGFVIFVHELGHFLVAKACGVKCPKFYLGFDVPFGELLNKLLRREGEFKLFGVGIPRTIGPPVKWGETEYGIGILPLGGYVRMLGQDDDPANYQEQLRESMVDGNSPDAKEVVGPDGKTYLVDKRSYMAKSVPQRMAIISAGVIMNVIFAFIFAVIAYRIGVPFNPSIVSQTGPGLPAWQADVRPGDEIVKVGDVPNPAFTELLAAVTLGDMEAGIPFVIRREDEPELLEKRLTARQGPERPLVGLAPPWSLRLRKPQPVMEFSGTARDARPPLAGDDEIVAVDGQPVTSYAEFSSILAQRPDEPLVVQVRRGGKPPTDDPYGPRSGGELVDVTVPPRPMMTLGLVMQMGKVVAVQDNSPAASKIQPGDFIDRISDAAESPGSGEGSRDALALDPMKLPEDLRRMANDDREVEISVRRAGSGSEGRQQSEPIVIALRKPAWLEGALGPADNDPVVAPALGIAYRVLSVVARVEPDGPAAKAGMEENDVVTQAEFILPEDMKKKPTIPPIIFNRDESEAQANWPALMAVLQELPAGSQVKLTFKRGDAVRSATLTPQPAPGYFVAERGFAYDWVERVRIAGTWSEAVSRGWDETVSSLGLVYRFLSKLGTQVSVTSLGGPFTIAQAAGFSAFEGPGKLLVFLTMLSANLAVINFLPIPLLDGGHMVFLLWEGIRGKPAGERFVMAMHAAGFVFIITLMVFVLGLDVRRLFFT